MSRYQPSERWDRERFDSHRGPGGSYERDRFEEERDYYQSPPRRSQGTAFAPRPPVEERDRIYEEHDRYEVPARSSRPPPRFYEEDERDAYATAMVPARRERERDQGRERDYEIDIRTRERYEPERERPGRFQRPQFVRRQSSLDTYDRKPMPRYGDRINEEVIPVPAPPRRSSPPHWRSPPRFSGRERERERDYYEEIRVAEPEYYGDEDFHGYREREISRIRRNRSPSHGRTVIEEKTEIIESEFPKRGKTKMPARLVEKTAIIQLGYPFEEEVRARHTLPLVQHRLTRPINLGRNDHHPEGARQGAH